MNRHPYYPYYSFWARLTYLFNTFSKLSTHNSFQLQMTGPTTDFPCDPSLLVKIVMCVAKIGQCARLKSVRSQIQYILQTAPVLSLPMMAVHFPPSCALDIVKKIPCILPAGKSFVIFPGYTTSVGPTIMNQTENNTLWRRGKFLTEIYVLKYVSLKVVFV